MSKVWQATVCVEYTFECEGNDYDAAHEDAVHVVWDSDNMSSWNIQRIFRVDSLRVLPGRQI